jgi:hypothetical protein
MFNTLQTFPWRFFLRIRLIPYAIKLCDPLKHLFFSVFFLIIGGLIPAYAQAVIDESMSGSWYDPSHDGEGFLLEVLEDQKAIVYWFTYDETGDQRWFIGLGVMHNDALVFDELLIAAGPVFGEEFNPDDVEYSEIGTLSISFEDCSTATATYTVDDVPGTQDLNRNWVDVHGAGAQRSDPKAGDPADYPTGRGPQGDAIRIYNHVRLVRNTP